MGGWVGLGETQVAGRGQAWEKTCSGWGGWQDSGRSRPQQGPGGCGGAPEAGPAVAAEAGPGQGSARGAQETCTELILRVRPSHSALDAAGQSWWGRNWREMSARLHLPRDTCEDRCAHCTPSFRANSNAPSLGHSPPPGPPGEGSADVWVQPLVREAPVSTPDWGHSV